MYNIYDCYVKTKLQFERQQSKESFKNWTYNYNKKKTNLSVTDDREEEQDKTCHERDKPLTFTKLCKLIQDTGDNCFNCNEL